MSGIRVSHLTKRFGDFTAVDDVSFDVNGGELAALLGPSGSGKSTILRIIAGLERPDDGQIFLTGQDVTNSRAQKRNVGFVFQHYALFKHMNVEKNIAFGLEIQKKSKAEIKEKVAELIDLVKLNGYNQHYPSQLSGGQRQRVALARALAPEPRVLLLVEPFGALDAKVRKNLSRWIRDLHDRIHVTSVFVTHDQNEAIEIADKLILVNRGRIEQIGTAPEVYETPATKFAASFVGNVNVIEAILEKERIAINGVEGSLKHQPLENGSFEPGEVILLVRPEDTTISREHSVETPGWIACDITGVHYRGSFYEIDLQVGTNAVKCVINKEIFVQQQWREKQKAHVHFKQYKVFEVSDGYQTVHAMLKQLGYIE